MKFCPECGFRLPVGATKFCTNCGKSLWIRESETPNLFQPKVTIPENSFQDLEEDKVKGEFQNQTIHSLGIKLEETAEQILKCRGYNTERRKKLVGNSGAIHEIDILAKRQSKILAVECKNYGEDRIVGIKEVRDFQSKIHDLPQINEAMFVTNTKFSSETEAYANHNQITLCDGDQLKNDFYLMNIGRLGSSQQGEIFLDLALPMAMNYREATKLELVNPMAARILNATLVLNPYYAFKYKLDMKKGFFREQRVHEEGIYIVDALTGEILTVRENIEYKSKSYPFFTKTAMHPKDSEQVLADIEKNQIIKDFKTIKPKLKYKVQHTGEYAIIKRESQVPLDADCRMVKEEIIEEKDAKYDEIKIDDNTSSIYLPKWVINIEAKDNTYTREALAASNTILIDEIALCPKEFFARIMAVDKQTYAICERCGDAYCSRHIKRVNNSYYCKDHS